MGMFDNYNNLNPDYIPDNVSPTPDVEFTTLESLLPRPQYDLKGKLVGYSWNHGDHFKFELSTDDKVKIFEDAIIYNGIGDAPDDYTEGTRVGQQAYNTAESRSWTYVGKSNDFYIWVEDEEFTYPANGTKPLTVHTNMLGKYAQLNIFNFRWEPIVEVKSAMGNPSVTLDVDEEISNKLKPGIYYCTLKIIDEDECTMCRVKNKFTITIN